MSLTYHTTEMLMKVLVNTREREIPCDDYLEKNGNAAEVALQGHQVPDDLAHHLSICDECKEEFEALQQVLRSLGPE